MKLKIGELVQYNHFLHCGFESPQQDLGVVIRVNCDNYEVFWFNDGSHMAHSPKLLKRLPITSIKKENLR